MAQLTAEPRVAYDRVRGEVLPFLASLHRGRQGTLSLLSGFRVGRDLKGVQNVEFLWPDEGEALVEWVTREALYGRDIYHRVAMTPVGEREPRLGALFVDVDCDSLFGLPEPSVIVRTSPGRGQCYWVLDDPVDLRRGERMCRRLFLASGATVAELQDVPLMRLPGVPNFKYPDTVIELGRVTEMTYPAEALMDRLPEPTNGLHRLEQRLTMSRMAWSGLLRARIVGAGAAVMSLLAFMSGQAGVSQSFETPSLEVGPENVQPIAVAVERYEAEPVQTAPRGPVEVEPAPVVVALRADPETPDVADQVREDDPLGDASVQLGEGVRNFWSRTSEGLASVQGQQEES